MEASALRISFPDQLAQRSVSKINSLGYAEFCPFIRIIPILKGFVAFRAESYSFERKLPAIGAHLLIIEVAII